MGTRGFLGFITAEGELQGSYNHFDSYPTALGRDVQRVVESWDDIPAHQFMAIRFVNADDKPTVEERATYAHLHDASVSAGDDWYSVLREQQGRLDLMLANGIATADHDFPRDSLFCEWAYVFDLRSNEVVILEGFNTDPEREAPYCKQPKPERESGVGSYWGCAEVWRGNLAAFKALDMEKLEAGLAA